MSAKRDYYEVVGISKTASQNEIKSQYRKLALKFHPDRNKSPEAADHFKEISEAYAVLSDPKKRQLYDQHGHAGVDGRYSTEDIFRGAGSILTIYLAICLEEEADKHLEALSQFSKIFLEADKDLVVLEGKGVLICYMKLLFL